MVILNILIRNSRAAILISTISLTHTYSPIPYAGVMFRSTLTPQFDINLCQCGRHRQTTTHDQVIRIIKILLWLTNNSNDVHIFFSSKSFYANTTHTIILRTMYLGNLRIYLYESWNEFLPQRSSSLSMHSSLNTDVISALCRELIKSALSRTSAMIILFSLHPATRAQTTWTDSPSGRQIASRSSYFRKFTSSYKFLKSLWRWRWKWRFDKSDSQVSSQCPFDFFERSIRT